VIPTCRGVFRAPLQPRCQSKSTPGSLTLTWAVSGTVSLRQVILLLCHGCQGSRNKSISLPLKSNLIMFKEVGGRQRRATGQADALPRKWMGGTLIYTAPGLTPCTQLLFLAVLCLWHDWWLEDFRVASQLVHLSQMQPETAAMLLCCQQTESLWTLRKESSPFFSWLLVQIWPKGLTCHYKSGHLRGVPNPVSSSLGIRSSGTCKQDSLHSTALQKQSRQRKQRTAKCMSALLPGWSWGTGLQQCRQSQLSPYSAGHTAELLPMSCQPQPLCQH